MFTAGRKALAAGRPACPTAIAAVGAFHILTSAEAVRSPASAEADHSPAFAGAIRSLASTVVAFRNHRSP